MTPFEITYYNGLLKEWVTETIYYNIDVASINLATDWRTKEVKGKRKQLIPLS